MNSKWLVVTKLKQDVVETIEDHVKLKAKCEGEPAALSALRTAADLAYKNFQTNVMAELRKLKRDP